MPSTTTITAQQFRALPQTNEPTELINGQVIVSPSPRRLHQLILSRLHLMLGAILTEGELLVAPMDIYLDDHNAVQPDILWLGPSTTCQLIDDYWHGTPDLVIEIASPSTHLRDRRDKFKLYERFGVREYWIVEPDAAFVEVWQWQEGRYHPVALVGADDTLHTPLLGQHSLSMADLFRD